MAAFNKIITYLHSSNSFNFTTSNAKGVERCVYNYLTDYSRSTVLSNDFRFRLVFHSAKELCSGNWQAEQDWLSQSKTGTNPYPIIHLTTFDIFRHDIPDLPTQRYCKILDSSIWNYYVPLEVWDKDTGWKYNDNYELFGNALKAISQNTQSHLYELAITHEFADLNARLLKQSFLKGTHNIISPFLFHSEKEMKDFIKSYEEKKDHAIPLNTICKKEDCIIYKKDEKNQAAPMDTICKYRWRFLLLDDKSIDLMTRADENPDPVRICKLKILAENLTLLGFKKENIWFRAIDFKELRSRGNNNRIIDKETQKIANDIAGLEPQIKILGKVISGDFDPNTNKYSVNNPGTPTGTDDIQIVIDCVKHVDAAQYCLQKYKYEIVLLDYLLDRDKVDNEQEYGYQLLKKLYDWYEIEKKKNQNAAPPVGIDATDTVYVPGPNNRFFFMFTSAFTSAVHERLLAEGFAKSERGLWYIGDGACPTNTPFLFSYQLMLLMRHRIEDIKKESEGGCLSVIDLLELIYVKSSKAGTEETRQKAHKHFNHVLFMREKYKSLEKDLSKVDEDHLRKHPNDGKYILKEMKSSLMVQSAFKVVHHFSGAFFEHLQHLVYLTAFGTIRQWQDMWEEYVFVNKELYDYDDFVKEKDENNQDLKRGKAISDAIREYIINLKENNY